MKISTKIIASTITSTIILIVSAIAIIYVNNKSLKEEFMREHSMAVYSAVEKELKTITEIGYQILESTHKNQVKMGNSYEYMMEIITKRFADDMLFFDDKSGYIFAYKSDGTRIAIPGRQGIGDNFLYMKDSKGKFFLKEIIDIAKIGGGITKYEFPRIGEAKSVPKIAYSRYYSDLDIVIGVGIFVDNIEKDILELDAEIQNDMFKSLIEITIYLCLFMIISILVMYFILKNNLIKPLNNIINYSSELSSSNGDLTKIIPIISNDEISILSNAINKFIEKVHEIVKNAKELSRENVSTSNELSSTSLIVGKSVQSSMELIEAITMSSASIAENISNKSNKAIEEYSILDKTVLSLEDAILQLTKMSANIINISTIEIDISRNIETLTNDANKINDVLIIIDDIADQTNLLSLNAAIEAARAGEHGRGFAVVADEVRKLAEKTQYSLLEIQDNVKVVLAGISNSSADIVKNSKSIEELSKEAISLKDMIKILQNNVYLVQESSKTTILHFSEAGTDILNVSNDIKDVSNTYSSNARSVEEIASASEHLNKMTEELQLKLQEFKTS